MTDQNQQALPPLDATPKWCPDCLTYHRCKPNEQLRQALRERDEAWKSLALFESGNPDLGDLSLREQLRSQLIRQGLQASEALAAANRRAEEAELDRIESAISILRDFYDKHRMGVKDVIQSQWARGVQSGRSEAINILRYAANRLRPTQLEQTQKEHGE